MPQLANKTPLPPPIPWCFPNLNPSMGPVAPLLRKSMKCQFDKHVRMNPDWKIGDGVWLNSHNMSTTRL
ncbi:uncharacterized protein VP01_2628g4, partial [Puccinia sorghi]